LGGNLLLPPPPPTAVIVEIPDPEITEFAPLTPDV
jgi:hypothetical protein